MNPTTATLAAFVSLSIFKNFCVPQVHLELRQLVLTCLLSLAAFTASGQQFQTYHKPGSLGVSATEGQYFDVISFIDLVGVPDEVALLKIDKNTGSLVSSTNLGTEAPHVLKTSNGNYLKTSNQLLTMFLPNGTVLWNTPYNASNNDYFYSAIASVEVPGNGFITISNGYSINTFPTVPPLIKFSKTDASGSLLWEKELVGATANEVDFSPLASGSFFVRGLTSSIPNKVWKIDANGNALWSYDYVGQPGNNISNILATPDGGVLLVERDAPQSFRLKKLNDVGSVVFEKNHDIAGVVSDVGVGGIANTSDGGAILIFRWLNNSANLWEAVLWRFDQFGNSVWQKFYEALCTFPSGVGSSNTLGLSDVIQAQDGGFFAVGGGRTGNCAFSLISTAVIKTDANGNATSPGTGIDLALGLSSNNQNPAIYSTFKVTATLTNSGTQAATNVKVHLPKPNGVVFQGGNEFTVSQGTYNPFGDQVWNVGPVGAGQTATISVNLFKLTTNPVTTYAQVAAATGTDADSTPGNGTCCTPNEDDEAAVTVPNTGGGGPSDQTINFTAIPDKLVSDPPFTVSATASSGLPVTFTLVSGPATVSGNTVTLTGQVGAVTIRATQAGNTQWNPATAEQTFQVKTANSGGQIDLSLSLQQSSASPNQWGNYTVKATLSNAGPQTATGVKVSFKKPAGVVYTGGNEWTASQGTFSPFGNEEWTVGSIPAGGSVTLTVSYFLLQSQAPVAYAQVSAANEVDSDSQPNNGTPPTPVQDDEAATSGSTGGNQLPDLTIADLQIPNASVQAGQVLNYSFDLSNIGTVAVPGNFTVKSYISTDNALSANDIQDGTITTGNYSVNFTAQNVPGSSTIPASLAAGNYFLIVKIDGDGVVAESNESNNTVFKPFTVTSGGGGGTPDCNAITITPSTGKITIAGASAPHVLIKVFKPNWQIAFECLDGTCANPQVISGLSAGNYFVEVKLLNNGWGLICTKTQTINVSSFNGGGSGAIALLSNIDGRRLAIDKVYPNPAQYTATLEIHSPVGQDVVLDFYDQQGRAVQSMKTRLDEGRNRVELNVWDWKSGVYSIILRGDGLPAYGRLMKVWEE